MNNQQVINRRRIFYKEPDYSEWETRIANKIFPHLLILEYTKKVHDAMRHNAKNLGEGKK